MAQTQLSPNATHGRAGDWCAHESIDLSAAFPRHRGDESAAIPKTTSAPGSTSINAQREARRECCRDARGLRERVPVQSRVQSVVRCAAAARYQAPATEPI